jgi:hypothetical protein
MKSEILQVFLLLSVLTSALLYGCAGQAARQVARIELAHVINYERELDKKIQAENQFYTDTARNIEERFLMLTPEAAATAVISKSMETADVLIGYDANTITYWDMKEFLSSAVSNYQSERKLWKQEATKIQSELESSVKSLQRSKDQLKEVRKKLEKLQSEPSAVSRFEEMIQFGKATEKVYDELNKKEEGNKQ